MVSGMKSTFFLVEHRQNSEASKYLIIIVRMRSSQHLIYISDIFFVCSAQVHNEFSFSSIYQQHTHSRERDDGIG